MLKGKKGETWVEIDENKRKLNKVRISRLK